MTTSMVSPSVNRSGGKYGPSKITFNKNGCTSKISSLDSTTYDNHLIMGLQVDKINPVNKNCALL